jgi:transposase
MTIIGFDLGKRNSQLCIATEDGKIVQNVRVRTTRESLSKVLEGTDRAKVLIESSTSSEWVARFLEGLGHTVIVADPRFGPMYAQADKTIKTDKRDAAALCHALRLGAFKPATRRDDDNRVVRAQLLVRANVVRMRAKCVVQVRALVEGEGIPLRGCAVEHFVEVLDEAALPAFLSTILQPLRDLIVELGKQIDVLDEQLVKRVEADPVARRFDDVVGIGPVTALAMVACVGDPKRFASARQVAAYVGLVPREYSSGEKRRRGTVTKAGDALTRSLLIQAGWRILRSKNENVQPLREWALRVAERRGRQRAVVAVARRLLRILFAMWRDDAPFQLEKLRSADVPATQPSTTA